MTQAINPFKITEQAQINLPIKFEKNEKKPLEINGCNSTPYGFASTP